MAMDSGCIVLMFHKKVEAATLSFHLSLEHVKNEVIYLAKVS